MDEMQEVHKEFLVESHENLSQLDNDLVALEKDSTDAETLARIFRTIHTVKGSAGFLAFQKLEALTHAGESLLSQLRDRKLDLTSEITSALLSMIDAIRGMLASIEATGGDGGRDYSELIEQLTRLREAGKPASIDHPKRQPSRPARPLAASPPKNLVDDQDSDSAEAVQSGDTYLILGKSVREPAEGQFVAESGRYQTAPLAQTDNLVEAPEPGKTVEPKGPAAVYPAVTESTIRVDVRLLDKLMNLTGELVLARNRILQLTSSQEESAFQVTSQHLNLVTSELQEGVMKIRMQPIGTIWSKFPRIVRDLALTRSKQVHIEMEGKETELDKTIIEIIKDPLTHLVRNAVDHGIEPPEVRKAAGKSAKGRLSLRAFHEGGQVIIEISDDGGGINRDRIRSTAIKRGLISHAEAAQLNDRQLLELMFLPGFSTAENVTEVSGRGVGMDVVKTNIEKIGGMIEVQSVRGKGTRFKIKLPLTLAIIPALIVNGAGQRFAIPQVSLLELVRLEGEHARKGIEMMHSAPVYRLRGNLVPLVYLKRELRLEETKREELLQDASEDAVNVVILEANGRRFGLVVDEVHDTQEIVTKPLGKQLKGIPCYAGAAIMGDGKVILILDVVGLAQGAKLITEGRDKLQFETDSGITMLPEVRQALLLVEIRSGDRLAMPLPTVTRLEKFPRSSVERVGNQNVIQYRDDIMPLIDLSRVLPNQRPAELQDSDSDGETLQVIVYTHNGRNLGLVVDRIVDVIESTQAVRGRPTWQASLGSVVIQNRVTEIIDIERLIRAVDPAFFEESTNTVG